MNTNQMVVIIANRYAEMLTNLRVDVIKNVKGSYSADVIVSNFQNFYFQKMILDITSVENYQDISTIQKLTFGLDMSKVILLLDDSPQVNNQQYLSALVSMGIYNFTNNMDTILYLLDHPNTYKDVAAYQNINGNANGQATPITTQTMTPNRPFMGSRVIGFKNLTTHAGATTFIYLLKKQLETQYKVLCLEVDKNDFSYFNDSDMRSVQTGQLQDYIKNPMGTYDIILVDLNESSEINNVREVIYLMEPSTIKINQLVRQNPGVIGQLKDMQLVLNQSLLSSKDLEDFEYEAQSRVFASIPPLYDKKEQNPILNDMLFKLGFDRMTPSTPPKKPLGSLFSIVKDE